MPSVRIALAAAGIAAAWWQLGALPPFHPRFWTSRDLRWYFVPAYEAFYGALARGAPMTWNPYQLCGMPWLGTLQGGFWYPPHALYLFLPTPRALAASTVLHLALGAAGTAALARRAGASAAGALLAAAVVVTGPPFRDWQLWFYLLEAAAWIPLGAIAVLELTAGRPARGAVLLAATSGMSWLVGCPQVTVFGGYVWGTLLLARLLIARPAAGDAARAAAAFAAGLVGGALVGAVTLLPGLELAQQGMRERSALPTAFMYPMGIPSPRELLGHFAGGGARAVVAAAAMVAPFGILGARRGLALWALLLGGAAGVLALGPATPAFGLYRALPLLAWFRVPYRALVVAQLCLGIAAALGLDALARRLRRPGLPAAVVGAVLAAALMEGLVAPRPRAPLPWRPDAVPWRAEHRAAYAALAAELDGARAWPFSIELYETALPPKLPTIAGLHSLEDYEPLTVRRQAEYLVYFLEGSTRYSYPLAPFAGRIMTLKAPAGREPPATRRRLLDLAAVRVVLMSPPTRRRPDAAAFIADAGLRERPPLAPGIEAFDNPHALPRAFVTHRARPAPPADELLAILADDAFDPLRESWVEGDAGLPPHPDAPPRGVPARIVRDEPTVVELEATLAAPGLVVLADTHFPGWTATVDGTPAPILATNHLFRGVPAPAGTHRVRFVYRPPMLLAGAATSLLAALGLLLAWQRVRPRRP